MLKPTQAHLVVLGLLAVPADVVAETPVALAALEVIATPII